MKLLFEIGAGFVSSTDARIRSGRMKLATSRSAALTFCGKPSGTTILFGDP
jgi:hypothetical protein